MYLSIYEPQHATMLLMTAGKISEPEWQAMYDDSLRLMEECKRTKSEMIMVTIAQPDTERPNANWRRKLGELRNHNTTGLRSLSVIVTPSILISGVITAINWVIPANSREKLVSQKTFEEAHAWLQRETHKPLDHLPSMYQRALAQQQSRLAK